MDSEPESADRCQVTTLLGAISAGDLAAGDRLLPLVYDELRRLAAAKMDRIPPGQTLQPTALVHEAFLKLVGSHDPGWRGRGHFFGSAARAMRQILVDQARRKSRPKHGGDRGRVAYEEHAAPAAEIEPCAEDMVELDEALRRLERDHPREAEIVMLRYFAGMTNEQVGHALGVSTRTVERGWRFARAWLHGELSCSLHEPPQGVADEGGPGE
jgi:RNA polymerase sigma factor (TIGR02999 family)